MMKFVIFNMKIMKKIIALGFSIFLLTGCSVDWSGEKDQKIEELEKQVIELKKTSWTGMTVFEKRTKCGTLVSDIDKKIDILGKKYTDLGKFSNWGVFYSPVKDACLWIQLINTYAKDGSPMERRALYEYGNDLGSSEPIVWCEKILGDKLWENTCEKWDIEIKKLQWDTVDAVLKS